jgi:ABC-type nitrate/sulfonate/bicarbonate transport system substrate-binding protein
VRQARQQRISWRQHIASPPQLRNAGNRLEERQTLRQMEAMQRSRPSSPRAPLVSFLRRGFLAGALASPAIVRAQSSRQRVDLLIDWKAMPTYAGFYLAREAGLFGKRGLDVAINESRGTTIATRMIGESQEYWIGTSSGAATTIGRAQGIGVKSLGVLYRSTPSVIFSRADAPIRKPADLYGKRIGLVPGSVTVDEYRGLLAAQTMDRTRITEVAVDWIARPLYDGRVDALIDYEEMLPAELLAQGKAIEILRLADWGVRVYSLNLIVREQAWQQPQRRDAAQQLVEAVLEAYGSVRQSPADAVDLFARLFPAFDRRYLAQAMGIVARELGAPPLGRQTREGWQATIDHLTRLGLLARPVSADEVAVL